MPREKKCQCGLSLNAQEWIQINKHIYQTTLICCSTNTTSYKCNPQTCSDLKKYRYNYYENPNSVYLKKHIEKHDTTVTNTNAEFDDFVVHDEL